MVAATEDELVRVFKLFVDQLARSNQGGRLLSGLQAKMQLSCDEPDVILTLRKRGGNWHEPRLEWGKEPC